MLHSSDIQVTGVKRPSIVQVSAKVVGAGGDGKSIQNEKSELLFVSSSVEGQYGPN